ncbi:hypothetical protein [Micromonospora sp. KC213]|uniref:hypothetical protein n=1 Tax=Micromonospora sp. KC213 TaxID=2530378 RepID=UPI0010475BD6|nr:hypothetical protein [Micromonospora sp. KC213]TDC32072.1 hypothetical protein E1166_27150 [Micromonospora sp. KC213]
MNAHRLDPHIAERLLGGPVVDPGSGWPQPLVRLLSAVRAAPRPAELRGERAAVRGFRAAFAAGPPGTGPAQHHPGSTG